MAGSERRSTWRTRLQSLVLAVATAAMTPACSEATPAAPPAPMRLVERSFFGMHFHWPDTNVHALMPPVGGLRFWDTRTNWAQLEPSPGNWDFRRLDRFMELAKSLNADVLFTLGGTPRWAAARPEMPGPYGPGSSSAPGRLSDWDNYVRTVAERYRGRIKAYEVLNEPKFAEEGNCLRPRVFYCANAAEVVSLVDHTAALLKSIDPKVKVLSPGLDGAGDGPTLRYVRAGGLKKVDALAFHFYAPATGPALQQKVDAVRRSVAAAGRGALPVWNSEAGFPLLAPPGADGTGAWVAPGDGPGAVSRQLIKLAAAGIARSYYYSWDSGTFGLSTTGGATPTPSGDAYLTTMSWLLGARIAPCTQSANVWRCDLQRGADKATIAWTERGRGALGADGATATRFVQPLNGAYRVAQPGEAIALSQEPTLVVAGTPRWGKMLSYVSVPR